MRYAELFQLYQSQLGDRVSTRTWDRLIGSLGLADGDLSNPDRRRLVMGAAAIRKLAQTQPLSRDFVRSYLALRTIQDASALTGSELLGYIQQVKSVRLRSVQRWFERSPNGVRFSLTRTYSGETLRFMFEQIMLRLYSRPSTLSTLIINSGGLREGTSRAS